MSSSKIHMTNIKSQNGAGLIAFFMAVILAGTVFLLANTGPDTGRLIMRMQRHLLSPRLKKHYFLMLPLIT